jgi:hypothetical protein
MAYHLSRVVQRAGVNLLLQTVLEVEQEVEAFVASLQAELEAVARLEEDFG